MDRRVRIVTYANSGAEAAMGYMALKRVGYEVRVYDGPPSDWQPRGLVDATL